MIDPMFLITTGIGIAFLLIFTNRISRSVTAILYTGTMLFFTAVSGYYLYTLLLGGSPVQSSNAGIAPPIGINLRVGLEEAGFMLLVNLLLLASSLFLYDRLKETTVAGLTLLLMITVGMNGLIMTRDLFNLFVFIEVLSIATYAFIALDRDRATLSAGFKYIIAGVLASSFLLLGIILVYRVTGVLSIVFLIDHKEILSQGVGFIALFFICIALLIELKPFPANGWALDLYQSVENGTVAIIAVGHTAAVLMGLYKILPLLPEKGTTLIFWAGLITFVLSNLGGLKQQNVKRMLGFSSAAQLGLVSAALAYTVQADAPFWLTVTIVGGLFINHFFAKAALFWLAGIVGKTGLDQWRGLRSSPMLLIIFTIPVLALVGLPPFPGFFAKWHLVKILVSGKLFSAVIFVACGSLFEAAYLLRWFGLTVASQKDGEIIPPLQNTSWNRIFPPVLFTILLITAGIVLCNIFGLLSPLLIAPLAIAFLFLVLDTLPAKIKGFFTLAAIAFYGWLLIPHLDKFGIFFSAVFLGGSIIVSIGTLNRKGRE